VSFDIVCTGRPTGQAVAQEPSTQRGICLCWYRSQSKLRGRVGK